MYYFTYGSTLSHKQMLECCPKSKPKFKATLPNYKLIFTGWSRKWRGGTASIMRVTREKVVGGVYEITERDLKLLDKHEDYPTLTDRLNIMVFTDDNEPLEAVTYVKRERSEETQPSREYLAIMQKGFKDWRIVR
ncbi:gamma-glutamylcyclotransferase family protein [Chloroflexota bacterium]